MTNPDNVSQVHRTRLYQLIVFAELAIVSIGLKSYFEHVYSDFMILFIASMVLLLVAWFNYSGRKTLASISFLTVLTLMLLMIMWTSGGLKDNSMIALPGLLIFSVMIGAQRIFSLLVLFVSLNLVAMGFASDEGLVNFYAPSAGISAAVNLVIIFIVVGLSIRILVSDNHRLVNKLRQQYLQIKDANQTIEHQVEHDYLTGLPNRVLAEKKFEEVISRIRRNPGSKSGMLFIDLDEFKSINEKVGHSSADSFLIKKTNFIVRSLRNTDIMCRVSGDEFLVIAEDINEKDLAQLAIKVQQEMSEEIKIDDHKLSCHCSIGVVVLPDNAVTFDQAIMRADIAMYRAKQDGKRQVRFYDEAMEAVIQRKLSLQTSMVGTAKDAGFFSDFQPIVELQSGNVKGAEALARWLHPEHGYLSPVEFIPIAESNGFINSICYLMLENACNLIDLVINDHPDFYVSINISPVQLKNPRFCNDIMDIVSRHELDTKHIKFEITESQMIESDADFERVIEQLRGFGVGLYLDDFGTGYSNLAHLQKMNFEVIKVDRSFVMDCDTTDRKLPLLKSIKSLSHELKVNLVAEGVESGGERQVLQELGVGTAQGYLWSKPVSPENFVKLL